MVFDLKAFNRFMGQNILLNQHPQKWKGKKKIKNCQFALPTDQGAFITNPIAMPFTLIRTLTAWAKSVLYLVASTHYVKELYISIPIVIGISKGYCPIKAVTDSSVDRS